MVPLLCIIRLVYMGCGARKIRPYKKWAFTLNPMHGILGNFVNSLRSDRTEIATKMAHIGFVNAAISPGSYFAGTASHKHLGD